MDRCSFSFQFVLRQAAPIIKIVQFMTLCHPCMIRKSRLGCIQRPVTDIASGCEVMSRKLIDGIIYRWNFECMLYIMRFKCVVKI
jgi:hypothetical protein